MLTFEKTTKLDIYKNAEEYSWEEILDDLQEEINKNSQVIASRLHQANTSMNNLVEDLQQRGYILLYDFYKKRGYKPYKEFRLMFFTSLKYALIREYKKFIKVTSRETPLLASNSDEDDDKANTGNMIDYLHFATNGATADNSFDEVYVAEIIENIQKRLLKMGREKAYELFKEMINPSQKLVYLAQQDVKKTGNIKISVKNYCEVLGITKRAYIRYINQIRETTRKIYIEYGEEEDLDLLIG